MATPEPFPLLSVRERDARFVPGRSFRSERCNTRSKPFVRAAKR